MHLTNNRLANSGVIQSTSTLSLASHISTLPCTTSTACRIAKMVHRHRRVTTVAHTQISDIPWLRLKCFTLIDIDLSRPSSPSQRPDALV